jgi:hypothetical protein
MASKQDLLFGELAVQAGFLTPQQLEKIIGEQTQSVSSSGPVTLGELCHRRGLLSSGQIRRVLEEQRVIESTPEDIRLGSLAVRNGLTSPEAIDSAVKQQKDAPEGDAPSKIGGILLARGALTVQELNALLAAQNRLRAGGRAEELDSETRQIRPVDPQAPVPPQPTAWLIQESGDDVGETFALGEKTMLGRLPTHDVPVPDMASSRNHAVIVYSVETRQHLLTDLDSRNGTFVNGIPVVQPKILRPGDKIRIGETVLLYAAGSGVEVPDRTPLPEPPQTSDAAGPQRLGQAVLARLRATSDRLLPGVHYGRAALATACTVGMLVSFFPWKRMAGQGVRLGIMDWGVLTFALFMAGGILALFRDRSRAIDEKMLRGVAACSGLASLIGLWRFISFMNTPGLASGIGVYLVIFTGLVIPFAVWFAQSPQSSVSSASPHPGTRLDAIKSRVRNLGGTTMKFKSASPKKPHLQDPSPS